MARRSPDARPRITVAQRTLGRRYEGAQLVQRARFCRQFLDAGSLVGFESRRLRGRRQSGGLLAALGFKFLQRENLFSLGLARCLRLGFHRLPCQLARVRRDDLVATVNSFTRALAKSRRCLRVERSPALPEPFERGRVVYIVGAVTVLLQGGAGRREVAFDLGNPLFFRLQRIALLLDDLVGALVLATAIP
jgi:hypothetical protein